MRKFHAVHGQSQVTIETCKSGDRCHGRLHFVAMTDQEFELLERAIQSQKRTWVVNEETHKQEVINVGPEVPLHLKRFDKYQKGQTNDSETDAPSSGGSEQPQ